MTNKYAKQQLAMLDDRAEQFKVTEKAIDTFLLSLSPHFLATKKTRTDLREIIRNHWNLLTALACQPEPDNFVRATTLDKLLLINQPLIFDSDEHLAAKLEYWEYLKMNAELNIKTITEDMPNNPLIQNARRMNERHKKDKK